MNSPTSIKYELMTKREWLDTHLDFRNSDAENPRICKWIEGKGTCSVPVRFTSND